MQINDALHAYLPFHLAVKASQAQNGVTKVCIFLIIEIYLFLIYFDYDVFTLPKSAVGCG